MFEIKDCIIEFITGQWFEEFDCEPSFVALNGPIQRRLEYLQSPSVAFVFDPDRFVTFHQLIQENFVTIF